MIPVSWTDGAIGDLRAICDYIALDSPRLAHLFVERIFASVERLSQFPKSGRVFPELGKDEIREVIHEKYRVVYLLDDDCVYVLTVFHGAKRPPLGELDIA